MQENALLSHGFSTLRQYIDPEHNLLKPFMDGHPGTLLQHMSRLDTALQQYSPNTSLSTRRPCRPAPEASNRAVATASSCSSASRCVMSAFASAFSAALGSCCWSCFASTITCKTPLESGFDRACVAIDAPQILCTAACFRSRGACCTSCISMPVPVLY